MHIFLGIDRHKNASNGQRFYQYTEPSMRLIARSTWILVLAMCLLLTTSLPSIWSVPFVAGRIIVWMSCDSRSPCIGKPLPHCIYTRSSTVWGFGIIGAYVSRRLVRSLSISLQSKMQVSQFRCDMFKTRWNIFLGSLAR